MKYFTKKLLLHVIFISMIPWATRIFEKYVKPSGPLSTYLIYTPLCSFKNEMQKIGHKNLSLHKHIFIQVYVYFNNLTVLVKGN